MFVWLMAATAPSTIEAIATKTMICCHSLTSSPKGPYMTRTNSPIAATLGAMAKNAVTGVGAPS
ncbi:hypothetical protein D3C83_158130 [compost metagenome]